MPIAGKKPTKKAAAKKPVARQHRKLAKAAKYQLRTGERSDRQGRRQADSAFLSEDEERDHGKEMEEWRGKRFKAEYLPLVRPFSAVPDLLRRIKDAGVSIAVASSAKKDELAEYLDIAGIGDLVDVTTSADDVQESKPAPDIFEAVLKKLGMGGGDAVASETRLTTPKRRARRRSRRSACCAGASRRTCCGRPDAPKSIRGRPPSLLASGIRCSQSRPWREN